MTTPTKYSVNIVLNGKPLDIFTLTLGIYVAFWSCCYCLRVFANQCSKVIWKRESIGKIGAPMIITCEKLNKINKVLKLLWDNGDIWWNVTRTFLS